MKLCAIHFSPSEDFIEPYPFTIFLRLLIYFPFASSNKIDYVWRTAICKDKMFAVISTEINNALKRSRNID